MKNINHHFHREYTSVFKIIEKEQENLQKRSNRYKIMCSVYVLFIFFSLYFFPIWMTICVCLTGVIFCKKIMMKKEIITKPLFLVIDKKYIQVRGRVLSWNQIKNIIILYEDSPNKNIPYNYHIILRLGKESETHIDSYYFEKQEEIVKNFIMLAKTKNIRITHQIPNDKLRAIDESN